MRTHDRSAIVALALALVLAGCSHHPKAAVEPPAADESGGGRSGGASRPKHTPAATPGTSDAVSGGSSTAPAAPPDSAKGPVVPQLSTAEAQQLEKSSREQIDAARLKLATLDPAKLDADRLRKFQIAQGFLDDAVAARTQQDWTRASQLATKARLLADELTAR